MLDRDFKVTFERAARMPGVTLASQHLHFSEIGVLEPSSLDRSRLDGLLEQILEEAFLALANQPW